MGSDYHPFHPFRGQQFLILKTRRVSGVDTLILRGSTSGTFGIPRAWTDRAWPPPPEPPTQSVPWMAWVAATGGPDRSIEP